MKSNLLKIFIVSILMIGTSFSFALEPAVILGHEGANGGNFSAQEIARMSGELLQVVKSSPALFPDVSVQKLDEVISATKLFLVDTIKLGDMELDGQNNGVDSIWINQSHWTAQTNHYARLALLFHEYLGILHLESNTYQISQRLLNPIFNLTLYQYYHCADIQNQVGYNLQIKYDNLSDRYMVQYLGLDAASVINKCKIIREIFSNRPCNDQIASAAGFDLNWGLSGINNIIERRGNDIQFENDNRSTLFTKMMFHDDGSVTFIKASGEQRFCSGVR